MANCQSKWGKGEGQIKVAVVLPCYQSSRHVLDVLDKIPQNIAAIYCVDDACPDQTGKYIGQHFKDKRLHLLTHEKNRGVGGAMITGYRQALADGMDIVVKIDSDGQMDPELIPQFIAPILNRQADYTKGNRFFNPEFLQNMPLLRLIGNAGLSFMNKFSTGYWKNFDPTNGYTAIHTAVLRLLPLEKISQDYFFESDMLFRLGALRAVVVDIPQKAIYGNEESHLRISKTLWSFSVKHIRNFFKRLVYSYFIRDFHIASIEWLLGPALLLFSLWFGLSTWSDAIKNGQEATSGTVMLAALPFIAGLQLTLSALHFDIQNQPKTPLHTLIQHKNPPHDNAQEI